MQNAKHIVVVPTYNERENIEALLEGILAQPGAWHVVVVDDRSPDGTGELAQAWADRTHRVTVIHRPGKLGLGTAHIAGIQEALKQNAEVIATMDADFSHHPRYLPALASALEQHAVVIGSRYVNGGRTVGCTLPRKMLSWGANAVARTLLGFSAHDCTAGFRCYRREVLSSIALDSIKADGYSFLIEMLYLCESAGWRVGEIPITFENRVQGQSKISRREITKALATVVRLAMHRRPRRDPGEARA
ncbi:MAG: polyprenol monophosphomannose synthase [Anaerolineae bacterium]|nr:polyprenol monophosphomannose synthase [Anaerolineae bacterium]